MYQHQSLGFLSACLGFLIFLSKMGHNFVDIYASIESRNLQLIQFQSVSQGVLNMATQYRKHVPICK